MAVTPQERQFLLDQLNLTASSSLAAVWSRASALDSAAFAAFMVDAFPEVASMYAATSSQLAATWFEMSAPASTYVAVTAPLPPVEKLATSARWALGATGETGLARMEGTLQRAVFDGARDTITLNVERTGSRWIRHARADACAFCRMLASRGAVYRSAASATDVGGSGRVRGTRSMGEKYHDHCRCMSVEIRAGQDLYDVVDSEYLNRIDQWEAEYKQAAADSDTGGARSILAAWRQQGVK